MSTAEVFQAKVTKTETNMDRWDLIVNGDDTTDVVVDSGTVPSFAKLQAANLLTVTTSQNWAESAGEPGGSGTKSAKTWALESASSAALVLAGAGFNYTPTYLTSISTGSRASLLTITTGLGISVGAITNLINGSATNDDANGVRFGSTQAVAGKALFTIVVNAIRYSGLFNQIKIKQSTNAAYGTYQIRLRTMDGTWEDHGSPVAVGGATEYTIDIPSISMDGYTGVELLGVSGTTPRNSIRMLEVELRAIEGPRNHVLPSPATPGLPGDRIVNGAFPDLAPVAQPRYNSPAAQGGSACVVEYWFDEPASETKAYNRRSASYHMDFGATHQSTYSTTAPTRTTQGLLFHKQMINTPAITGGLAEFMVLWKVEPGNTTLYEIATAVSGAPIYTKGSTFRGNTNGLTIKALMPNGEIAPLFSDNSGTVSSNATWLNRGGWVLLFIQINATYVPFVSAIGFGGHPTETATTNRANYLHLAMFKGWNAALPDDAARKSEADWVCRGLAYDRGIRLRSQECAKLVDLLPMWGQSNTGGDEIISAAPKQLQEMVNLPGVRIQACGRQDVPFSRFPVPYSAGGTAQAANPSFISALYPRQDGRKHGPDWALARKHTLSSNRRPLVINKVGAGSSILGGPPDGLTPTQLQWNAAVAKSSGMLWFALSRLYECMQHLLSEDTGFTVVAFFWGQGETDSNAAALNAQSLNWDDNYEALFAAFCTYTGLPTTTKQIIVELRAWETNSTLDATKVGQTRTSQANVVAADPTNRVLIDTDGSETDAWGRTVGFRFETNGVDKLHYNGALYDRIGEAAYAAIPWSTTN